MVAMSLPDLVEPTTPPDKNGTVIQLEKWKVALRKYDNQVKARKRNTDRAYGLFLGQCSQALRNRMEADSNWNSALCYELLVVTKGGNNCWKMKIMSFILH
jgi:hypothetical protein